MLPLASFSLAKEVGISGAKLETPPTIDGVVEQGEWQLASSATGFVDENTGQPAEPGEFWLGYDAKFIYFAAKIRTDPSKIKATEYRQNVGLKSDDAVYIQVDPFGLGTQRNTFGINPKGATTIEIAGGRAPKNEWLGEIQASGRMTEDGYEVEARIPWSIMKLPNPGKRDLRVQVGRYNPNIQRFSEWVYTPGGSADLPYWRGVDLPAADTGRSIKLLPYAYAGVNKEGHIGNAGLDVKSSITDSIEAVATVNPDFRNIENQILSLDFSYFERLANESRPFFLEGNSFFSTSRDAPLFTSQRIRKFDAGFKSYGQITDQTRFALLDTIDFGERNNFVLNARHQINDSSGVSGAITTVSDKSGADNIGTYLGFDTQRDGLGFFGQYMTTRDTDSGTGHRYNTGFFYQRNGWEGGLEYLEISEGYLPRLGFAPERNLRGITGNVEYGAPVKRGPLMEWGLSANARTLTTIDGAQYRRGTELASSLTFRDGTDFDFGTFIEKFRGSNDQLWFFSLERPRGDSYRHWQLDYLTGHISGQKYSSYGIQAAYRPLQRLQLSLRGQEVHHFDKSTQVILGANLDIGKDMSVSGRAVRSDRDLNGYLAFRKSGSKGAEYFVIFGDPNSRTFRRALVVKAVFPIELKF